MVSYTKAHFLIIFFILFNMFLLISPLIVMWDAEFANNIYSMFHWICHQRNSRSYCLTSDFAVVDCVQNPQPFDPTTSLIIIDNNIIKYKFLVCSRDIGIYIGMLIGMILFWQRHGPLSEHVMNFWFLILFMLPTGIDGGMQLLSTIGIKIPFIGFYESTNIVRLTTGLLAGIGSGYVIIPIINIFSKKRSSV